MHQQLVKLKGTIKMNPSIQIVGKGPASIPPLNVSLLLQFLMRMYVATQIRLTLIPQISSTPRVFLSMIIIILVSTLY